MKSKETHCSSSYLNDFWKPSIFVERLNPADGGVGEPVRRCSRLRRCRRHCGRSHEGVVRRCGARAVAVQRHLARRVADSADAVNDGGSGRGIRYDDLHVLQRRTGQTVYLDIFFSLDMESFFLFCQTVFLFFNS